MNKKDVEKLNEEYKAFCHAHGINSAFGYCAMADSNNVAMVYHNVSDAELINLVPHIVDYLAQKNNVRSAEIWLALIQAAKEKGEFIPANDLN